MQTGIHWAFAILALAALCSPSSAGPIALTHAQAADVQLIDVMDYGIYTANKTATAKNDLGLAHDVVNNIQLVAATRTIDLQPGMKFGFRYTIFGSPQDAPVTIRQVVIFPPEGVLSPEKGLIHTHAFSTTVPIGVPGTFAGYGVEDPWELVPGIWTIQLWIGDKKFAEQSFTVTTKGTVMAKGTVPP